jgi:hypothetical protein
MTTLCVCVCVCFDRVLTINLILFHHKFSSGNFFVHLYVYTCFEILWNHSLKFVISKLCVMWYSFCTSQFVFLCCLINFTLQTNFVSKMLVLRSSVANKIHGCHHAYNRLASGENKVNSLTTSGYLVHNAPVELPPPPPGPSHCPLRFFTPSTPPPSHFPLRFFNPLIPPPLPLLYIIVGARGRRPLWSPLWVPVTFGHSEVL